MQEQPPLPEETVILPPTTKKVSDKAAKRNSTIVSVIIHALLILMGLYVVVFQSSPKEEVAFIPPDRQRPSLEPRKLEMKVRVNQLTKRSSRPRLQPRMMVNAPSDLALPEIKHDPKATKNKVQRNFKTMGTSGFGSGVGGGYGTGMGGGMGGMGLPASVADRCSAANRTQRMRKSGGRAASEKAVQKSLAWFQTQQNSDGSFGEKYKVAMTGLALLAYLGHCETPDSPIYGETVEKAINYLISMTGKGQNGLTSDTGGHGASYSHGIATYALGEAFIMTGYPEYREPFLQGVQRIITGQNTDGGWVYAMNGGNSASDTSVSGWQIQALKSAYLAGLEEIESDVVDALDNSINNIKRVHNANNGGFGYRGADGKHKNLTGVGVFSLSMWKNGKSREARRGVEFLMERTEEEHNWTDDKGNLIFENGQLYSMYYDTQALFAVGGREWKQYNDWFQKTITDAQLEDGSWPINRTGKHHGGGTSDADFDVYRTALYTLMLEVYYRYLPVVDM